MRNKLLPPADQGGVKRNNEPRRECWIETVPSSAPLRKQHCKDVDNYHDVVKGYTVVYRYNGRDITTALPYNPGKALTKRQPAGSTSRHARRGPPASLDGRLRRGTEATAIQSMGSPT